MEEDFQNIIKEKFELGKNRKSYAKWDSINHVKLILKLEASLKIEFSQEETFSIQSTDDLFNLLKEKNAI